MASSPLGGRFVHSANGQPVRFWAVNGPPHLTGEPLPPMRLLALWCEPHARPRPDVRQDKRADLAKVRHTEIVAAMKAEGIYTHFSIYFPLWFTPRAPSARLTESVIRLPRALFNQASRLAGITYGACSHARRKSRKALGGRAGSVRRRSAEQDSFFFWRIFPPATSHSGQQFGVAQENTVRSRRRWLPGRDAGARDARRGRIGFRPLWNISTKDDSRPGHGGIPRR